jgi:hypothetical protein
LRNIHGAGGTAPSTSEEHTGFLGLGRVGFHPDRLVKDVSMEAHEEKINP